VAGAQVGELDPSGCDKSRDCPGGGGVGDNVLVDPGRLTALIARNFCSCVRMVGEPTEVVLV